MDYATVETHKEATADLGIYEIYPDEMEYGTIAKYTEMIRPTMTL